LTKKCVLNRIITNIFAGIIGHFVLSNSLYLLLIPKFVEFLMADLNGLLLLLREVIFSGSPKVCDKFKIPCEKK